MALDGESWAKLCRDPRLKRVAAEPEFIALGVAILLAVKFSILIALGLAEASKPLRTLLAQILQGEAGPVQ